MIPYKVDERPVAEHGVHAVAAGHDDRVIARRFSEKPVGLQLDALLGKDIEMAVRGNGLDIDFMQPGFPGGVPEDFKRSSDIAGQHPVIDDDGDLEAIAVREDGRNAPA